MTKLKLRALNAHPSNEDEDLRQYVENEAEIESATRGKPMKSAAPGAGGKPSAGEAKQTSETLPDLQGKAPEEGVEEEQEEEELEEPEAGAAGAGMVSVADADAVMDDILARVGNGGAQQGAPAQPAALAPAGAQVATTAVASGDAIAETIGNVAAGVVTAPFYALSSAYRLLNKAIKPNPAQGTGLPFTTSSRPGMTSTVMGGVGAPLGATEVISHWKCDKIEDAQRHVLQAAEALRKVDAFPVWEDAMLTEAGKSGLLPSDVVARMRIDPDLAPLKEQMTALWRDHPKEVEAYRQAAGEFEKHIKSVQRKYANSEPPVQKRVFDAMETVREGTSDLPGFGRQVGEYTPTLAERLRELARAIVEFVSSLLARLQARAPSASASSDPTNG